MAEMHLFHSYGVLGLCCETLACLRNPKVKLHAWRVFSQRGIDRIGWLVIVMTFFATLILSFLVIGTVVITLSRVRTPRYRLRRENVIALLKMVLDGSASEHDWNVFVAIPIRYDPELEYVRNRCIAIEESEFLGNAAATGKRCRLFTRKGLDELEAILLDLQAKTSK